MKAIRVLAYVGELLKTYPAMSAALLNVCVAIAAYFGFHLTAEQITGFFAFASIVMGMLVHSNVVPLTRVEPTPVQPVAVTGRGGIEPDPGVWHQPAPATGPIPPVHDATLTDLSRKPPAY